MMFVNNMCIHYVCILCVHTCLNVCISDMDIAFFNVCLYCLCINMSNERVQLS